MKKSILLLAALFLQGSLYAQLFQPTEIITKIEEDYSDPTAMMWEKGGEFQARWIEDGMYKSKGLRLGPELEYSHRINQLACKVSSDMEFTIVKLKGSSESLIQIELYPNSYKQITFQYNEKGLWNLQEGYNSIIKTGTATVNVGSNILKIVHRRDVFEYYLNGVKITDYKAPKTLESDWEDIKIYSKDLKMQLGLDKVVLIGYLDEENKKLGSYELERFSSFNSKTFYNRSDVFAIKDGPHWRLMDDRGRISKNKFDKINGTYAGDWLIVSDEFGLRYGYIDKDGNEMLPMKYKEVSDFLCTENNTDCFALGCYRIKDINDKIFYINPISKEIIDEAAAKKSFKPKVNMEEVNLLLDPSEGLQLVKHKSTNKFGYINNLKQIVIPMQYESASSFGSGLAPVTLYGHQMYIDKNGNEKINADGFSYTQCFYNGYAVVKNSEKKYAFIDTTGKNKTGFIYTYADGFSSGLAAVCLDGKCGFLDLNLKPAVPLIYQSVDYFSESGLAHVLTMDGKHGYINKKGEFVIPAIYTDGSKDWNLISNNPKSGWPYHTYRVELNGVVSFFDANGKDVTPGK